MHPLPGGGGTSHLPLNTHTHTFLQLYRKEGKQRNHRAQSLHIAPLGQTSNSFTNYRAASAPTNKRTKEQKFRQAALLVGEAIVRKAAVRFALLFLVRLGMLAVLSFAVLLFVLPSLLALFLDLASHLATAALGLGLVLLDLHTYPPSRPAYEQTLLSPLSSLSRFRRLMGRPTYMEASILAILQRLELVPLFRTCLQPLLIGFDLRRHPQPRTIR